MVMNSNEKAHKYPKQIFDAKKAKQTLAVEDRLSAVDETANATYLEILHPAAVYRVTIIDKYKKGEQTVKQIVKANIRPEHLTRINMRLQMAEQMLFDMEAAAPFTQTTHATQNEFAQTMAFTEKFRMGNFKGRAPGDILTQAMQEGEASVQKMLMALAGQRTFLSGKLDGAYADTNKRLIQAIDQVNQLYQDGKLNAVVPVNSDEGRTSVRDTIMIYDPPEKTFRSEKTAVDFDGNGKPTKYLVNAYKIQIAFLPNNTTSKYKVYIMNQNVDTVKDGDLEKIVHISPEETYYKYVNRQESTYYLSSDEMVEMCTMMRSNLARYEDAMYTPMRKKDENIFFANRQQAKQN